MTTTQTLKSARHRLRELRREWRTTRSAAVEDPFRIELALICPTTRGRYRNGEPLTCGDPTCEGCAATLYRRDRLAEIEAEAAPLAAVIAGAEQ